MDKRDILLLLQQLLRDAVVAKYVPDDPSGLNTIYMVDQERLMANIEKELEQCGR